MKSKVLKYTLIILSIVLLMVAGTGAWAGWRVYKTGLGIDFIKPYVELALFNDADGYNLDADKLLIYWDHEKDRLAIDGRNVVVYKNENELAGTLDLLRIDFDTDALFKFSLAPRNLIIRSPRLFMGTIYNPEHHTQDSRARRMIEGSRMTTEAMFGPLINALRSRQIQALQRFEINDLKVSLDTFEDVTTDQTKTGWFVDQGNIGVYKSDDGIGGKFDLTLKFDENPNSPLTQENTSVLTGKLFINPEDKEILAITKIDEFELGKLALLTGTPQDFPVTGQINADITAGVRVKDSELLPSLIGIEISSGPLTVTPQQDGASYEIVSTAFSTKMSWKTGSGTIEKLEINSPYFNITGNGTGVLNDDTSRFDMKIALQDVNFATIMKGWPEQLAFKPRRWIANNISEGSAELTTEFSSILNHASGEFVVESANSTGTYSGLTTTYFRDYPTITAGAGTLAFDILNEAFTINVDSGKAGAMDVTSGKVHLYNLYQEPPMGDITANITGSLKDSLQAIDRDPVNVSERIALDIRKVSGHGDYSLHFVVPLLNDVPISDVTYDINGQFKDLKAPNVMDGLSITGGTIEFKATQQDGLSLTGPLRLNGAPADLDYTYNFETGVQSYGIAANLAKADYVKIGAPELDFLDGKTRFKLNYTDNPEDDDPLSLTVDFKDSTIPHSPFGWTKSAGTPGTLSIDGSLQQDGTLSLPVIRGTGSGLDITADAVFSTTPSFWPHTINLTTFKAGRTNITGAASLNDDDRLTIDIKGPALDISGEMNDGEASSDKDDSLPTPVTLNMMADTLYLKQDTPLNNAKVNLRLFKSGQIDTFSLKGMLTNNVPVTADHHTHG